MFAWLDAGNSPGNLPGDLASRECFFAPFSNDASLGRDSLSSGSYHGTVTWIAAHIHPAAATTATGVKRDWGE
ncbi:MAG: hypothetical protein R3C99_25700 [Pirellulaceae bacterium]